MQKVVTCPLDCPDACRLVLEVEDGRVRRVRGDAAHPTTRGFACAKTTRFPERLYAPDRPLYPMRRVGPKGEGRFQRISWEAALDEIAEKLKATLDTYGGAAVLRYNYAGTMGLIEGRHPVAFFRAIGATELDETICSATGEAAWAEIYGPRKLGVDPEDVPKARVVAIWGANVLSTNTHLVPFLREARKNGAEIIAIDVYENRTARFADRFIRVRPGTDAALALAIAHVLFAEGWVDRAYLDTHTEGLDAYLASVREWPPERAAALTGVPSETIADLARTLAMKAPQFFRVGYGMTRHPGGGSALVAVLSLPVILGAWRFEGGGAMLSTSGGFALNKRRLEGLHFWQDPRPDGYFRPNPGVRHVNQIQLGRALTALDDPPVKMLFVFNANPAATAPRSALVRQGLLREDLVTVVLENAMSDTARYADYLLPATHPFEHPDLYASYGHYHLSWSEAAVDPPGEARPNTWVFAQLARRLGLRAPELFADAGTLARELLDSADPMLIDITFERLVREGSVKLRLNRPFLPYAEGRMDGRKLTLRAVDVRRSEPEPAWPLVMISPPAHHFLNTSFGLVPSLRQAEGGEPWLWMHPADAAKRGLAEGDRVRVRSAYGEVIRRLRITDATQPGVVVLEGTWRGLDAPDGKSINELTPDEPTDMGGGSAFHGALVEVLPVS